MARLYHIPSVPGVSVAYTVDRAVGQGCLNNRGDVMLVQHLLRIAWRDVPTSKGFRPPGEEGPLKVDGWFGPKTAKFIKFFQEEANRRGAIVGKDGRVDPVRTGTTVGSISKTFYTILALNSARNSRQAGNQADIQRDPEFKPELRKQFYIDWI
jgi:hypothetical protein